MGKVLVIYDSVSGNTKQMAAYVAEAAQAVPGIEVRLVAVEKAAKEDALWADGIAAGSPTYVGTVSWRMKKYWDDIALKVWGQMDGKLGCAFSTQGGWGGRCRINVYGAPYYVDEHGDADLWRS